MLYSLYGVNGQGAGYLCVCDKKGRGGWMFIHPKQGKVAASR
jgi:hypothetical protein